MRKSFLALCALTLLCGCKRDRVITDTVSVNDWIYDRMKEEYLWSAQMRPLAETDRSLTPTDFFDTYIRYRQSPSVPLESDLYGDRFSAILFTGQTATRASASDDAAFGFGFEARQFVSGDQVLCGQVIYVHKGSPAERAGLRRGDCFDVLNGEAMPILQSRYRQILQGGKVTLKVYYPEERTISLVAQSYDDDPVLFDTIYLDAPRPVGYVVYNRFAEGGDGRYDRELEDLFARFRTAGVQDLILDLRYNGGGELTAARYLASLIVRRDCLGKVFIYKERNHSFGKPDAFESEAFLSAGQVDANLDAERLFVLTSGNTASASELVIHALKPYYGTGMTVIGRRTRGKNLGGITITNRRYEWELHPVTIRVYNCEKVSGYEAGIAPDVERDEFVGSGSSWTPGPTSSWNIVPFGDPTDPLLGEALDRLGGRAAVSTLLRPGTLNDTKSPAAGLVPPVECRMVLDLPEREVSEGRIVVE